MRILIQLFILMRIWIRIQLAKIMRIRIRNPDGVLLCRPSYRELGQIKSLFPGVPIIALTATATPHVQKVLRPVQRLFC